MAATYLPAVTEGFMHQSRIQIVKIYNHVLGVFVILIGYAGPQITFDDQTADFSVFCEF